MEYEGKYAELYRRVETTCKCRYNASSRIQWQHALSQWIIALLSLALLVVQVVKISGLSVNFSDLYADVMQIIFAILILIYALLIGSENFSRRAEKLPLSVSLVVQMAISPEPIQRGRYESSHAKVLRRT